jgi:hypothetical protein
VSRLLPLLRRKAPQALLGFGRPSANDDRMSRRRTTARGVFLLLTLSALLTGTAAAHEPAPGPAKNAAKKLPQLVFPVVGQSTYQDDFGDARGTGSHEGNDIMAPKRALAVAAEAGRVKFWTTSSNAGCMLYLEGESGTTYLYIHLNNDLTAANDNKGSCVAGVAYAKGLASGDTVAAGEPVGFVGDSGDADGIASHLHFEVHPRGGAAVNPFKQLQKARRLLFAAAEGSTFTLALTGKVVTAATGTLSVSVERIRSWPGGRKIAGDGRTIAVSVPETAALEGPTPAGPTISTTPAIDALLAGTSVTVFTEPASVTLAAKTGAKGALAAKRVVVKPA